MLDHESMNVFIGPNPSSSWRGSKDDGYNELLYLLKAKITYYLALHLLFSSTFR